MDLRGGEAREPGMLGVDDDLRLVGLGGGQRALGGLERVAHERTPTSTSRNRAGDAPCDMCAPWPGCPFPQFVMPMTTHSSGPAIASIERQNGGVIPV